MCVNKNIWRLTHLSKNVELHLNAKQNLAIYANTIENNLPIY